MLYRCSKCDGHKPFNEFPPSKATNSGQWCRACLREQKCGPDVRRACDHCGSSMVVTTRRASEPRVFCSRQCKEEARRVADKAARVASKSARSCLHCGGTIGPERRVDAAYCSERCNQAAHNAVRKASWKVGERQESVSRAYIVARDNGTCHLCGKKCRPDEIHLDHLVPLSRGGDHSAANLRVACAACNLSKRAEARGEQLLLIG